MNDTRQRCVVASIHRSTDRVLRPLPSQSSKREIFTLGNCPGDHRAPRTIHRKPDRRIEKEARPTMTRRNVVLFSIDRSVDRVLRPSPAQPSTEGNIFTLGYCTRKWWRTRSIERSIETMTTTNDRRHQERQRDEPKTNVSIHLACLLASCAVVMEAHRQP